MTNQVKLHVGYIGKTRQGKRVEIFRDDANDPIESCCGDDGIWRYRDGRSNFDNFYDIIGPWTDDTTQYKTGVWYGWNGGECPVHPETFVDLVLWQFSSSESGKASEWDWGEGCGIFAFRIVTPYVESRKPREFWLDDGSVVWETYEDAKHWCEDGYPVLLREVIEADDQ